MIFFTCLFKLNSGTLTRWKQPDNEENFDFNNIFDQLPTLKLFNYQIDSFSFDPLMDSSNMNLNSWTAIANEIEKNYFETYQVNHKEYDRGNNLIVGDITSKSIKNLLLSSLLPKQKVGR